MQLIEAELYYSAGSGLLLLQSLPRRGNELIRPQASTYPTPLLTTLLNPCLKLIKLITMMMTMPKWQCRQRKELPGGEVKEKLDFPPFWKFVRGQLQFANAHF